MKLTARVPVTAGLLTLMLCSATGCKRLQSNDKLNKGVAAFKNAKYEEATNFFQQAKAYFLQLTGDPALSAQMALQALAGQLEQQASSLGFFDCFWIFAVIGVALALLVPLMKRSAAEKGAHIAAE